MTIKKALTSIVLTGLALGGTGCVNYGEYHFDGKIGKEEVKFYEVGLNSNVLTITKPDGRVIKYFDNSRNDLKLESVRIRHGGSYFGRTYSRYDEVGKTVLEKAQKQFDDYLHKINEIKTQEKSRKIKQKLEEENKRIKQGLKNLD